MKSVLAMSRALVLGLIWGLCHGSSAHYCVEQPYGGESFSGESITIPCRFTYSETIFPASISFEVKASHEHFCRGDNSTIYNSSIHYTSNPYAGRLSAQVDLQTRTSSLIITDLKSEDQKKYCCRYTIYPFEGTPIPWQIQDGTRVVVRGEKEMILEQEPFILALPGDIVTIIARFKVKNQTTTSHVTGCGIYRSTEGKRCGETMYPVTCTQSINGSSVVVIINNTDYSQNGFYCLSINVSRGGVNYTGRENIGSNLLVLQSNGTLKINQTSEVEFRGPVRINCSFSIQDTPSPYKMGSVLWTRVYWMTGEPRERFVYHPNKDYIHPRYKGTAELIGRSDLLLKDFHGPDNTTLYCRIAIRFCTATDKPNSMTTILDEGPGTLIRVYDNTEPKSGASHAELTSIIVASCVGCAILLFFVLLIVCLKTRRDEKKSSYRETIVESLHSSVYRNSAYENMKEYRKENTEMDEKTLYATVTHSAPKSLQVWKEPQDDKMVYVTVKHSEATTPTRPQVSKEAEVIYADVKKH
ncbi:uncharacterized protein [Dendropsophus ebraccatus]|uniref:uncharacterized protein n=1 Tax=Dendropsophus ebraccatus TaxID=150705 RepID=UPI0038321690